MEGLFTSFKPFFARYRAELILLCAAFIIAIISGTLYVVQTNTSQKTPVLAVEQAPHTVTKQYVSVDVSGAVQKPGVYQLVAFSRFNDALKKAGGLASEADKEYVERNFNLARIVTDQEKIYIPFQTDTANGIVKENTRILDYTAPATLVSQTTEQEKAKVDINLATVEELDTLTGIGKVQADAIIKSRPYKSIEDLVTNNVIRSTVYEKIKNEISVQ